MHADDVSRYLDCYANSKNITAGMSELRNFLGVEYQKDGVAWINGFLAYLGDFIPISIPTVEDTEEQDAILYTICRHENRNPNRIYRSYMFRNGRKMEIKNTGLNIMVNWHQFVFQIFILDSN